MTVKRGRFGSFLACTRYPDCKTTKPISLGVKCPRPGCGGFIAEKRSRRGKPFYGCSNWAKKGCDFVTWDRPIPQPCPVCQAKFVLKKETKRGTTLRCARYATYGTQALSDAALEALKDRKACLLGQHGQIALGKTLDAALWMAIEVETLARMYQQALVLGEPPVLPDDEMDRVIAQMTRMSYGLGPEEEGANDIARPRS